MKSWTLHKFLLLGLLGLSAVSAAGCVNNNDGTEPPGTETKEFNEALTRTEYKDLFEKGQKGYCEKITQTCETQEPADQQPNEGSTQVSFSEPFNATVLCKIKGRIDGDDALLKEHCEGYSGQLKEKYKALRLPECDSGELETTYEQAKKAAEAGYTAPQDKNAPNDFCIDLGFPNTLDKCRLKGFEDGFNAGAEEALAAQTNCAQQKSDFKLLTSLYADAACTDGLAQKEYDDKRAEAVAFAEEQVQLYCAENNDPTDGQTGTDMLSCKELGLTIGHQWGLKTGTKVCTVELKFEDSSQGIDYSRCSTSGSNDDRLNFEDGLAKGFINSLLSSEEACKIETVQQEEKNNQTCEAKVQKTLPEACTDQDVKELARCYQEKLFTCDYSAKSCVEEKVSPDCRKGLDLAPLEVKPQTTQE